MRAAVIASCVAWLNPMADVKAADQKQAAYPGLPKLTLSTAAPVGDPDARQLARATRWTVEHGAWMQHRDALDHALVSAAGIGGWMNYENNLGQILDLGTPSLMLSQDTILHKLDPSLLRGLPNDSDTTDFLTWLFTDPRAATILADDLKPGDNPKRVLEIWRDCWISDRDGAEKYAALAFAVAADFQRPIAIRPDFFDASTASYSKDDSGPSQIYVDPVERYKFYRDADAKGILKTSLADMEPYELVWVVDAPLPSSELLWAQQYVNYSRADWGQAYASIRYRMDKATNGTQIYTRYTLAEIKARGGVCVDQAYYAEITAKANGIPAMSIIGEGERGSHAWVQWESSPQTWSEAGRYDDNYSAGETMDPQTHRRIKEQELGQLTMPGRRADAWVKTERYIELSRMFTGAHQAELAQTALDAAIQLSPESEDAWNLLLDNLAASKASAADWETAIARMRAAFQKYPDILQQINKRETAYLAASGDTEAAMHALKRQETRLMNQNQSRTDLILNVAFQEADLATKNGDTEQAARIYRDALREKGRETVGFRQIAEHYYDWAKSQGQGSVAAREIGLDFEQNFQPDGDYFQQGAYEDTLKLVIDMYEAEGLQQDADRLELVSERVQARLKLMQEENKHDFYTPQQGQQAQAN